MKKIMAFLICLIAVVIGVILTMGSKDGDQVTTKLKMNQSLSSERTAEDNGDIAINLKMNQSLYNELVAEENELVRQNDKKFGEDIENGTITLTIFDIEEIANQNILTLFESNADGIIEVTSGKYEFKTSGNMEEIILNSGRKILNGSFEGTIENKVGEEIINLSLLYDLESEKGYVNVTSGYMWDTAAIPFGKTTVNREEMAEVYRILTGEDVIN